MQRAMFQDIGPHAKREPLRPSFSVANAIREQVEYEDAIRWARTPDPAQYSSAELRDERKPIRILEAIAGILP